MALVRAAESEQDAAIYLTAAFTGLRRGELIALRWRDVDFAGCVIRVRASYSAGALTTPKSGKLRSVPMAPQVAESLARLGSTATDDGLVFLGEGGGYLDGSALRRRYKLAAPKGVNGRNSDNTRIKQLLGWAPSTRLRDGLEKTYAWVYDQIVTKAPCTAY